MFLNLYCLECSLYFHNYVHFNLIWYERCMLLFCTFCYKIMFDYILHSNIYILRTYVVLRKSAYVIVKYNMFYFIKRTISV